MRHLIFALMIALLPLRGWVGDAMATQMAVHAVHRASADSTLNHQLEKPSAIETIAAGAGNTSATGILQHQPTAMHNAMPPDCLEHGGTVSSHETSADVATTDAGGDCADCAFCQACHTVALTSAGPKLASTAHPGALPQRTATQFASAEAAPGHKPPIS